ncbi:NADH-quinone oxidoreductase subunit J [Buchnera aphidicola]|uniref:NADH-quinone oxidoreductase subunit J n=1 Tax=Buchnera aphidicola TaxID=9 RepID=UPI0031B84EAD
MEFMFYFLSFVSIFSTLLSILNINPIYSLLYLIVSFLSLSGIFFILGAFYAAAIEIILYAGAIMVLFVFVIMFLNLGNKTFIKEKKWFSFYNLIITFFFLCMMFIIFYFFNKNINNKNIFHLVIDGRDIGFVFFGEYSLLIEIISMILLTSLIIVFHISNNIY